MNQDWHRHAALFVLVRIRTRGNLGKVIGHRFHVVVAGALLGLPALGCAAPDPNPYAEPEPTRGPVPPETSSDYALSFDGTDDYVTTATSGFPFAKLGQTITAWIKIDSSEGQRAIFTLRRNDESGTMFGLEAGRLVAYNVYGMRLFVESEEPLSEQEWHHVAYTQEAMGSLGPETFTQRLYVDGSLVATGDLAPQNRTPTIGFIGAFDSQRSLFVGELDELRVWSRKLEDAEIEDLASGSSEPSRDALIAYWSFDEAPGQGTAYDRSTMKNHAALGDGAPQFMPTRLLRDR